MSGWQITPPRPTKCALLEDGIRRLGDNVVLILTRIKESSQPQIMHFFHDSLLVAEQEIQKPVDADRQAAPAAESDC